MNICDARRTGLVVSLVMTVKDSAGGSLDNLQVRSVKPRNCIQIFVGKYTLEGKCPWLSSES